MRLGIIWLQFQRPAVAGDCLLQLSLFLESSAQVAMKGSISPLQPDCPSDALDGNLVLAELVSDDPEEVQCLGMIRLDGENLPVSLFGSLQSAGVMMLDRNCQRLGNRCHNPTALGTSCPGCRTLASSRLASKLIPSPQHGPTGVCCGAPSSGICSIRVISSVPPIKARKALCGRQGGPGRGDRTSPRRQSGGPLAGHHA